MRRPTIYWVSSEAVHRRGIKNNNPGSLNLSYFGRGRVVFMEKDKNHKVVWLSGEKCEISAAYFSNHCFTRFELKFAQKDIFARCPRCREKIKWQRVNGTS